MLETMALHVSDPVSIQKFREQLLAVQSTICHSNRKNILLLKFMYGCFPLCFVVSINGVCFFGEFKFEFQAGV